MATVVPASRTLRLTIGYRGTGYAGWASQPSHQTAGQPTLQATLEASLQQALGHPTRVRAAGRTDAGVHAEAQVVAFETTSPMPAAGLRQVLPHWLPADVWLVDAAEAPTGFDPRRAALRRWYCYAVWRDGRHSPSAAWQGRCLLLPEPLDLDAMRQASQALLGRHDLASFATQPPAGRSTLRTVFAADWLERGPSLLLFEICADGFLKQMVRGIVGSLLWVGRGHWTPAQFVQALGRAERRAAGPNAPAVGLSLFHIDYPREPHAYLSENV